MIGAIQLLRDHFTYTFGGTFPLRRYPFFRTINGQNVIFVHIPKTAGTSISRALKLPPPHPEVGIEKHYSAEEIIQTIGMENWTSAFKVTCVRHPVTRLYSHYAYRKRTGLMSDRFRDASFDEWAGKILSRKDMRMMKAQSEWLKVDGILSHMDTVLRFETLEDDFLKLCAELGIQAKLPHLLRTPNECDKIEISNESVRSLIHERFLEDFKNFNYRWNVK